MAVFLTDEESGFFNAVATEVDGEITYDRSYTSEQFCEYFSLFVGNGVFVSPENQLMVSSGESIGSLGRNIVVNTGWAFINGMFYHNKEVGVLDINPNTSGITRRDGVFCRFSKGDRSINIRVEEGRIVPKKLEYDYELLLAIVEVGPNVSIITNANITDKRPDETVCGFVKGLVDVIESNQLFQQFQAQFGEWFTSLQEFFGSDALGTVMSNIQNLQTNKVSVNVFNTTVGELEEEDTRLQGEINKKSNKSVVTSSNLASSSWSGTVSPFTYNLPVTGVNANTIVEISLSSTATKDQVREWGYANIMDGGQSNGTVVLKAWGMKPTLSLPINVIVRGDV